MTDELASLPPSILREVVLRLICPEKPPPLRASSNISFFEAQATASLRPEAARRLSRSPEALDFLNRFNAQAPLLDELAGLFLEVAEAPSKFADLLNPYCAPSLVFGEVLYAYEIVKLGASAATMERMMVQLVRGGWWRQAEELALRLGRRLTRAEVLRLVESYTRGAVYSSDNDRMWPQFAERHLGPEAASLVRRWISERNDRAAHDPY